MKKLSDATMKLFSIPRRDVTSFPLVLKGLPGWVSAEQATARLQAEFVRRYGYLGAFAVGSGRDGLRMLLRAVRGSVPDLAWVPAWTIPAVPEIFQEEGFDVRFIDTDPATLSLTPGIVERTCTAPGLLLVTHYFGLPAEMKGICRVASARGLKIIEDCAHAPGAFCDGRPVGSFGLGGFLSFETRKPLNGLGGGLVVTNHERTCGQLAAMERGVPRRVTADLMKFAMTSSEWLALRRPAFAVASRALYSERVSDILIGLYRKAHAGSRGNSAAFSDRQAVTVLGQIDSLDALIRKKRDLAAIYDRLLPEAFSRPLNPENRPHGYYMYVTTHPDAPAVGRALRRLGVDCGIGPEVLQMCGGQGVCPGAAELARTAIELPMYASLSPAGVKAVCRAAAAVPAAPLTSSANWCR